jgi:hypothetical protein
MPANPNQVSDVTVSVHLSASNPLLPIIAVKEVIKNGSGTLTETIFGGRVTLNLKLVEGKEVGALTDGELVYVKGHRNGAPFTINSAMTTDSAKAPWEFSRISG